MSALTNRIPLIGGERPEPGGAITTPEQLAYVLSEVHDDASPINIRRWLRTVNSVWDRLPSASVKPSREAIAAAIRGKSMHVTIDGRAIIVDLGGPDVYPIADAVLALLPGRSEAEVREQVALRAAIDSAPLLEAAWDEGNAMGLDGWTGPGRGSEPDQHAIDRRERTVDRLVDDLRARIVREGGRQS